MTERYALRFAKFAYKELYELQPKQFKKVAKKIFFFQETPGLKIMHYCRTIRAGIASSRDNIVLYTIEKGEVRFFRIGKRTSNEVYENM